MSDELPSWLDAELWQDFIEHRRETGRPLTATAQKRALIKLYRMKEAGEDIDMVLEQSIERGWRGLFPVAPDLKQSKPQSHQEAKHEPVPEITEEQRQKNLEYLQRECGKVFNINGGRSG